LGMATKTKSGRVRMDLIMSEAEYLALEQIAKEAGLTVLDVVRMKLKGFEPRKAA